MPASLPRLRGRVSRFDLRRALASRIRLPASAHLSRGDGVGESDHAASLLEMEGFDQTALEADGTFASRFRLGIRGNQAARPRHLLGARGESGVRRRDLIRMDQRLAIEAEITALPAGGGKAFRIPKV